jgi:hypothetical protein
MKLVIVSIITLAFLSGFAQSNDPDKSIHEAEAMLTSRSPGPLTDFYNFNYRYAGAKGNPFLEDDFLPGQVITKNSPDLSRFLALRYNLYTKKLSYHDPKTNKEWLFDSKEVECFYLYDSALVNRRFFVKTPEDVKANQPFLEVIHQGGFIFYNEWQVMFLKAAIEGAYSRGKNYDEFKKSRKYIIYSPLTEKNVRFKSDKLPLKKLFGHYKKEAKQYIKTNKVRPEVEKELLSLLIFMERFVGD